MARQLCSVKSSLFRKASSPILACFWTSGLLCGILFFLTAGSSFSSVMHSFPRDTVSIVSLLCITTLPFLLSIYWISISKTWLIFPLCFGRAFLLSYTSIGIIQLFGSAGWLFRCLLLFSSCITAPLLYCFWLRGVCRTKAFSLAETIFILAIVCLIRSLDYRIISPFLACLIEFWKG